MRSLRNRRFGIAATVLVAAAVAAGGAWGTSAGAAGRVPAEHLPPGFTDTVVAGVPSPTALAQLPDGRMLVTSQLGKLYVIKPGSRTAHVVLDLTKQLCSQVERGLLGVAVDPQFARTGHVFLYYTFRKTGCAQNSPKAPVNRVARFTMVGNKIVPSTQKVLIDGILNYAGNHNGGNLGFGHDGMLYVSVGDGGCNFTGDHGCGGENAASRLNNVLLGKVLRITPSGGIPASNPFRGAGTARCNNGPIAAGMTCQETYMHGFRNPFRFAFDPNVTGTRMFVDDVGQVTWEEIDLAKKGADYGWNVREGHCANGSTTDCGPPPKGMTNPIFDYGHTTGCGAITGGAFVPDGLWGPKYQGGYLFGDFVCNRIFLLSPNASGGWTRTPFAIGLDNGGPVALLFATHRSATALYYTTYGKGGGVHVIQHA